MLKVCANHFISADMKLTPLSTSDRAWCYTASDFAEGEIKVEKFAVKFKNPEKAGEFKAAFESCQKEIHEGEASGTDAVDAGAEQEPKESADGVKVCRLGLRSMLFEQGLHCLRKFGENGVRLSRP